MGIFFRQRESKIAKEAAEYFRWQIDEVSNILKGDDADGLAARLAASSLSIAATILSSSEEKLEPRDLTENQLLFHVLWRTTHFLLIELRTGHPIIDGLNDLNVVETLIKDIVIKNGCFGLTDVCVCVHITILGQEKPYDALKKIYVKELKKQKIVWKIIQGIPCDATLLALLQ